MKLKAILTLTIIGLTTFCFGQSFNKWNNESGLRYRTFTYYYNNAAKLPVVYNKVDEYITERGIDTITLHTERIKRNGKAKLAVGPVRYIYNDEGEVIRSEGIDAKTGDVKWYTTLTYDHKGYQKEVTSYDKEGVQTMKQVYLRYDSTRNNRQFYKIDKRGDTATKSVIHGIDTNTLVSTDYYYVKGKLKYTWKDEYYPNKSRKRCTFYKKGKEKYVWDYQCKEEGVEVKKHKDTSTICVSKEWNADSVLTRVYHNVSAKGVLTKTVIKTNTNHQRLYYKETRGVDDHLVSEENNTFAQDGKTLLHSENKRYVKGVVRNARVNSYDVDGNVLVDSQLYYDKKGKLSSEYIITYEYNAENLPVKRIAATENGNETIDYYVYE
jgi:hypothetical protein